MKNNLIASGKIFVGKVNRSGDTNKAHGPRNCPVYVTFELTQGENGPEFSSQAEAWDNRRTDVFHAGQCHESFAKMMHGDARRILEIWREWHLNDMKAGTPEQEAEIDRRTKLAKAEFPEIVYPDGSVNYYKLAELSGLKKESGIGPGYYDLVLLWLKQAGLYEVPLSAGQKCTGDFPAEVLSGARGYRYGERWLYRELPAAIVEEVKAISIRCKSAAVCA
jgi:hypothetical protein